MPAELDQARGQALAHRLGVRRPARPAGARPVAGVNGTDTWSFG